MRAGILFGGFDAVSIGMAAAGLTPIWSIEIDPDIAAAAQKNLDHKIIVEDILNVDPSTVERVQWLHASPPCPSFSVASQSEETETDMALADKISQFISVHQPSVFTLENVWLYRKSVSWTTIQEALYLLGYWIDVKHSNAADFGVPQTRKRMIVRAIRGAMVPYLPEPEPWRGWYQAIEDLIPTLPISQFADWQIPLLPDDLKQFLMPVNGEFSSALAPEKPSPTITTGHTASKYRAMVVNGDNASRQLTVREADAPIVNIGASAWKNSHRAFLLGNGQRSTPKYDSQPSGTITSNNNQTGVRAYIVDCQKNGNPNTEGKRGLTNSQATEPVFTVTATQSKRTVRMCEQGRVVSMTPRALARFQTFPDWYVLPDSNALACKGIGNAMPALWYQKIARGLMNYLAVTL